MNSATTLPETVLDAARAWPGVSTRTTSRGATAIVFEGHELGHVHPDRATLDLPLPEERRRQALETARVKKWYSNWVSKALADDSDAKDGVALLQESYREIRRRQGQRRPDAFSSSPTMKSRFP